MSCVCKEGGIEQGSGREVFVMDTHSGAPFQRFETWILNRSISWCLPQGLMRQRPTSMARKYQNHVENVVTARLIVTDCKTPTMCWLCAGLFHAEPMPMEGLRWDLAWTVE